MTQSAELGPASLNARLFAFVTDGIPLALVESLAFFGLGLEILQASLFNFVAFQLYFTSFWWLNRGQTPGMRAVGIRVSAVNGADPTLGQAAARAFVLYAASAFAVLAALLRKDQRGLHDLAARTQVVVQ